MTTNPMLALMKRMVRQQQLTNDLLRRLIVVAGGDVGELQQLPDTPDKAMLRRVGTQVMFGGEETVKTITNADGTSVQRYPMDDNAWLIVKMDGDGTVAAMVYEDKQGNRTLVTSDPQGNIRALTDTEVSMVDTEVLRFAGI